MTFDETGSEGTTVEFIDTPSSVEAGTSGTFSFQVNVGDLDPNNDLDVSVSAFLYVSGTESQNIEASTSKTVTENDIVKGILSHTFPTNSSIGEGSNLARVTGESKFNTYPRIDEPVWIKVEVDYYGAARRQGNVDETASTSANSVNVTEPTAESEVSTFESGVDTTGESSLSSTFQQRTDFSIKEISYEEDANYLSSIYVDDERQISFDYGPNPTVSIDTSGRFAKHEIIGGTTVRQKIGEDPINISIDGVCKRQTANQIDSLRDAKNGKIFSNRLPGNNDGLRVQFGSTMTEPLTDGGAADLKDGNLIYSFQINAIEVIR